MNPALLVFYRLLDNALPSDVEIEDLLATVSQDQIKKDLFQALSQALRACQRLNWQAYLANNPDVKAARMDPCNHFISSGLFEGRKLTSWHPLRGHMPKNSPKVSVIVPNYNNALFLEKCLESVAGQSLADIEIIVVDDHSTDNSCDIINNFVVKDKRFHAIFQEKNKGTHMARKAGVLAASGDYVMFVDSDDFYQPDACEKAWTAVSGGFDIGVFNVSPVNHVHMTPAQLDAYAAALNTLPPGAYEGSSLLSRIFVERTLGQNLIYKIFERHLIQESFRIMEDGHYTYGEDMYEILVISHHARNLIKIEDRLYNYSCGYGISWNQKFRDISDCHPRTMDISWPIERYCRQHSLDKCHKHIRQYMIGDSLDALNDLPASMIPHYFRTLLQRYAPLEIVRLLFIKFYHIKSRISSKLIGLKQLVPQREPRRIAISFYRLSTGGVETTIRNICRQFAKRQIDLNLFLQERSSLDMDLPPGVRIYYLPKMDQSRAQDLGYLEALAHAVEESQIDLMLNMWPGTNMSFWQTTLLHLYGIPVIGSPRLDHNQHFTWRGGAGTYSVVLDTWRAMEKMFCLSTSTEIYLRANGIDATCIPNSVRISERPVPLYKSGNNIAVIARLDEHIKRAKHALFILHELVKTIPDARIIFIGDFNDTSRKKSFYDLAERLGIKDNFEISGWINHPAAWLDKCRLLLSTSWLEGFPNGIAEAQIRGLPVVMYYLDILLAKNNPSIIPVPQGAYKEAASNIASLLTDNSLLQKLSDMAIRKAAEFTDRRFSESLLKLIKNYAVKSPEATYHPGEYNEVIKNLAFYAGKGLPDNDTFQLKF